MANGVFDMRKDELDTPCLVVDLDVLEKNIRRMAECGRDAGVALRPMVKTHKCPAIAHMQLRMPATVGINASKVAEAEVMAFGGAQDIFITNEIIGVSKVERLIHLAKHYRMSASVDSLVGAKGLDDVAKRHDVRLDVLIHIDSGNRRTGVLPGEPALQLVREILKFDHLNFKGIWTHEGQNYGGRTPEEVLEITMKAGALMIETKKFIERETGLKVYTSVGSTPGAKPLARMPGIDEIRPGAYVFNDGSQIFTGSCTLKDCALTILCTIVSHPEPHRIVTDAGTKANPPPMVCIAFDEEGGRLSRPLNSTGGGIIRDLRGEICEEMVCHRWGEEYGMINLYGDKKREIRIGDKIEIIPYHVCDTVNLFEEIFGVREGEVEVRWPIWARGRVQ